MKSAHGRLKRIPKHSHFFADQTSGRIYYIKRISGSLIKISSKTTSISEAKKFVEEELVRRFSSNPKKDQRKKLGIKNPKISELWKELLEQKSIRSKSTLTTYRISWEHGLAPFWGEKHVNEVTRDCVNLFERWYLQNHPKRNFFNTRKHLVMLFNYLKINGYIFEAPPISRLDSIINQNAKREKVGRVYSQEEIDALIQHSQGRTRLAILMGCQMGMRKMEILTRQWKHVKFKERFLSVWSSKNRKWRDVPIPKTILDILKTLKSGANDEDFIFHMQSATNRNISGQQFDKEWVKVKELASISGWDKSGQARFHDLRHTFATMTARDNWPPMIATKVLDMSLEEYERTYTHVTKSDIYKFMAKSLNSSGGTQ
jgi:integrase